MARFAPVAPAHILQEFADQNILGEYHLLLAHDIVANPIAYERIFRHRKWEGVVILDNSIIELGDAVDIKIIAEAAKIVRANVMVLPDVLLDGTATARTTIHAIPEWCEAFSDALDGNPWELMAVPQGKTIEEFTNCVYSLTKVPSIKWWGVPRNTADNHGTRSNAMLTCKQLAPERKIHLLGFSENLLDDVQCARSGYAEGIDSAVPIRIASDGLAFYEDVQGIPPRGDWWSRARYIPGMSINLERARAVFGDK